MGLTLNQQLTAEQRLSQNIVSIMNHDRYVALAGVLMIGDKDISDDMPTACTNGRDEWYGREFVMGLTDAELRFLILHENYHKLFRHLVTWVHLYERNPKIANMACDYVINQMIVDDNYDGFATMPVNASGKQIGLLDSKFRGMDSQQVFDVLEEDPPEDDEGGEGEGGGMDEHDWEGAQEMSDDEERQLVNDIDEAIRQGALTAGKMGSGGNRAIDSLLQPEIDWREVLREFITQTCRGSEYSTYARPNRRYMASGMYLPSGVSEKVDELVIAIDTSGSIGQSELTKFLSEIKGVIDVVNPSAIRLLYWDTKVCGDEVYGVNGMPVDSLVQSTKPAGGGGTDITCVHEYIQKNQISAQAVIVFTDGYLGGRWGTWSIPLLWCIADNKSAKPTNGKAVHITL
jgi:predicted metal-dependent peptidase